MSGLGSVAYLVGALVVGLAAIPSRLGLLGGFLLSVVLTPLGGLLVVLASELLRQDRGRTADTETATAQGGQARTGRAESDPT